MNVLEPILERHFHPDSYACRKGKGIHAASDRLQYWMRRRRYALQCDIRKFFPSVDHEILKGTFRRLIKDDRVLWLMDLIVDHSNPQEEALFWFPGDGLFTPTERRRGLPIGNLTSQWFANWMLNGLDHFVTRHLGFGVYVHYCDDFILLHDDRDALKNAIPAIRDYLASVRLRLHEHKLHVRPVRAGLTFVGYRTWATHRLLKKTNVRALRRRVRWMREAYARREIGWHDIRPRLASWLGHAKHADSKRLVRRISREWRFIRGEAANVPCSSRRRLGQRCAPLSFGDPLLLRPGQPQQQRVPSFPALSPGAQRQAQNRAVHGSRECGLESPGLAPVPSRLRGFPHALEFFRRLSVKWRVGSRPGMKIRLALAPIGIANSI